jgi:hypothetical protein
MKPTADERRAIVDELGQLEQDIAPLETKEKRAAELRGVVRAWFPKMLATATVTETGHKFFCTIGPKQNQTAIASMEAVYSSLNKSRFLAACSFTLKSLKELLPTQYDSLTVTDRTGSRPVKTFAKAKA